MEVWGAILYSRPLPARCARHPPPKWGWASKHSGGRPFSQNLASPRLSGGGGPRSGGRGHLKMVNGEWKMVSEGGALWKYWGAILYSRPLPSRCARHPPPNGGGQVSIVAGLFSPQSCLPLLVRGRGTTEWWKGPLKNGQ